MIWSSLTMDAAGGLLAIYLAFLLGASIPICRIWRAKSKNTPFTYIALGLPIDRLKLPLFRWGHSVIDLRISWFLIPAMIIALRPLKKVGAEYEIEALVGPIGIDRRYIDPNKEALSFKRQEEALSSSPLSIKAALDVELARRGPTAPCEAMLGGLVTACSLMLAAFVVLIVSTTMIVPTKDIEAPFRVVKIKPTSEAYKAGLREGMTLVGVDKYHFVFKREMEAYLNFPVIPEFYQMPSNMEKISRPAEVVTLIALDENNKPINFQFPVKASNGIKLAYRQREFRPEHVMNLISHLIGIKPPARSNNLNTEKTNV